MTQPSIARYFNIRKRPAVDDYKIQPKILKLESETIVKRCVTPPNPPDVTENKELDQIKKKLCRSSRLKELKASINKFKESESRLKQAEKRTEAHSPKIKSFKSVEFEVSVSPQKVQSPEKPYLSPKKESTVRRNLLGALSPKKKLYGIESQTTTQELLDVAKPGLRLPYKYRSLAEVFRAVDVVTQILYNRKETISFKKLKPAVEEMLKKTFTEKHLAQIKHLYPNAYNFTQEKLRQFGMGMRQDQWDLVVTPEFGKEGDMTSEILLTRRRNLYETLINLTKQYHNEFLLSLSPPLKIDKDKITHWHPEFDIEKVPDIEEAELPQRLIEEKYTTGKEVLEKVRQMFNCNTRMDKALTKLKEIQEKGTDTKPAPVTQQASLLKGIPQALLDKVREKQAAKALISMTRSADKEKEVQMYSRLPEIARLTRSLFVTEKKSVLQLEIVIAKLRNSYRCFLTTTELKEHLKAISVEVPEWLIFHNIRGLTFLKLSKNADLSIVLNKLEGKIKERTDIN